MARRSAQLDLLNERNYKIRFGGSLLKNSHPKVKRDLLPHLPIHLVLRSTKATGHWNLLRYNKRIHSIVLKMAHRYHIKLRKLANSGNHLHIIIELRSKDSFAPFIKAISSWIVREVTGAWRGNPLLREFSASKESAFWTGRPFTRIGTYGSDSKRQIHYLNLNKVEAKTGLKRPAARALLAILERSDQILLLSG